MGFERHWVLLAALLAGASPCAAAIESGWWWNPAESGRGLFIERQGDSLYLAAFLYADDGRATWTVANLANAGSAAYVGTLQSFSGGQTLGGNWTQNTLSNPNLGAVRIDEVDARHARLSWPGGVVPIERLELFPGSLDAPRPPGSAETGWWWNPAEPGRGFGVDIQGGVMFLGGFMYDSSGQPVWYVSGAGAMSPSSRYEGNWMQFAGGQTLAGAYRPAQLLNANDGSVRLEFATAVGATLTLPDGSQTTLTRLVYASQAQISWTPTLNLTQVAAGTVAGNAYASSTRLRASWQAPSSGAVQRFELVLTDLGSGQLHFATTTALEAVFTELKSDTRYRLDLSACSAERCYLSQQASASAQTPAEVWQLQGSGANVNGLRRSVSDGNVKIHALRYGNDAPAGLAGRVQAYYGPSPPATAGLTVAVASAAASAVDPASFLSLTSLAGSAGLQRPSAPARWVADVATGQAVPLSSSLGGRMRLYFEAPGGDGRTRILSLDAQDGYLGRDFNAGAASVCSSASDYGSGGGCDPAIVIAVEGDVNGNPKIRNARQFKIGFPTLTDWRWDGTAGTWMWFTTEAMAGCSTSTRNHVYAVYDGTRWVVPYAADGCPRHLQNVQAGHPLHLGGARYKFLYGDTRDLSGAIPGSTLPFLGPKRLLYADGARRGLPGQVDFDDWEGVSAGRNVDFLWPDGSPLSATAEGYIDDFSLLSPTGTLDLQLLYLAITDGRIAPIMASALLINP